MRFFGSYHKHNFSGVIIRNELASPADVTGSPETRNITIHLDFPITHQTPLSEITLTNWSELGTFDYGWAHAEPKFHFECINSGGEICPVCGERIDDCEMPTHISENEPGVHTKAGCSHCEVEFMPFFKLNNTSIPDLHETAKEYYITKNSEVCPICKTPHDLYSSLGDFSGKIYTTTSGCRNCDNEWTDTFVMTRYSFL